MTTLVLTVIGDDRPGLVKSLADVVAAHQGNWQNSQLSQLAGQFAGLVEVEVADDRLEALVDELRGLDRLDVTVRSGVAAEAETGPQRRRLVLDLVGNDRAGIVAEITTALAGAQINIERLETSTEEAPMAGGSLFRAQAELTASAGADLEQVTRALERLADELMVDLTLADG